MAQQIAIDRIEIGSRLRTKSAEQVALLADSIATIGLRTPVTVVEKGGGDQSFKLVAGVHRIEACRALGWNDVPAEVATLSEIEQEIWQIDENLICAELTMLERAEHLQRRREIVAANGSIIFSTRGGRQQVGFAKFMAAKTGRSKKHINDALYRADHIAPEIRQRLHGTPIADNGSELDALARAPDTMQRRAVALVLDERAAPTLKAALRSLKTAPPPCPSLLDSFTTDLGPLGDLTGEQLDVVIARLERDLRFLTACRHGLPPVGGPPLRDCKSAAEVAALRKSVEQ